MDSNLFSEIALIGTGGSAGVSLAVRYLFQKLEEVKIDTKAKIEKMESDLKTRYDNDRILFLSHIESNERLLSKNIELVKNHSDNELRHHKEKHEEQYATIEKMLTRLEDKLDKYDTRKNS